MIERIDLRQLTQDRSLAGDLSPSNNLDIYTFELNTSAQLNISFNGDSNDQNIILGIIIWQDQDNDNSYDRVEEIAVETISTFPDNNEFDLLNLLSGEYNLSVAITEDSPTEYQISLDLTNTPNLPVNSNSSLNNSSNLTSTINVDSLLNSPIYRFQNQNKLGTYVFVSAQEGQNIINNYPQFKQEGFAFAVGTSNNDELMAMYRFHNTAQPGTYLYANAGERSSILANYRNFQEEGLAFYVLNPSASSGNAFYGFHINAKPETYIFVGEGERQNILNNPSLRNFQEEGIAFKVSNTLPSGSLSRLPEPEPIPPITISPETNTGSTDNLCGQVFRPGSGEYYSCLTNLGINDNITPGRTDDNDFLRDRTY